MNRWRSKYELLEAEDIRYAIRLTANRVKLVKIGARIVRHGRYLVF
jgi:hypothetical protein